MAEYIALERVVLGSGIVEKGQKFASDAVPGRHWKPVDKEAKAAVRARDERAAAAAAPSEDPRVADLEGKLTEALDEINRLQAEVEALTAPPPDDDQK